MRKIVAFLIILLVIYTISGSLQFVLATEGKRPIKIGVSTWPGWCYVFLAKEKGIFKKNNVKVELIHIHEHIDAQVPFVNGELDGVFQCFTDTIIQNVSLSSKVVYISDYSALGDVIVGKADRLSDLKGKTVGIEGVNTFSHIFVLKALEDAGLSEHDINFKVVAAHKLLEALEKGNIDAGHTWEPTKSDAVDKGYNVLGAARDNPGIISDLLVFNSKLIEKRPEDIQAIVKSLVEAQIYRDANWTESIRIMSKAVNMSYIDMESGILGTNQLSLQNNITAFEKSDNSMSLYVSGKYIADFYLNRGQLPETPKLENLLEPRFIKHLIKK